MSESDFIILVKNLISSANHNQLYKLKCYLKLKRISLGESVPYDEYQTPLLFYAIQYSTDESTLVLDYFLENITDLSRVRDLIGRTSLVYAIELGNKCAIERILFHSSALLICGIGDKRTMTPMLLSCKMGFLPVVERLIELGADINQPDKDGSTPLHYASMFGHADIIALLIEKGADAFLMNSKGWTAVDYAYSIPISDYIKGKIVLFSFFLRPILVCQQACANGTGVPNYPFIQQHGSPMTPSSFSKHSLSGSDMKSTTN